LAGGGAWEALKRYFPFLGNLVLCIFRGDKPNDRMTVPSGRTISTVLSGAALHARRIAASVKMARRRFIGLPAPRENIAMTWAIPAPPSQLPLRL